TESSQMRFSKRAPSATHTSWPLSCCFISRRHRPTSTLFPYTTLFRSRLDRGVIGGIGIHRSAAYRSPVSDVAASPLDRDADVERSEEHTSELQSRSDLVCRLLLEKKKSHCKAPIVVEMPHLREPVHLL